MVRVYVICGGILGWDWFSSPGMLSLSADLHRMKGVYSSTHAWSNYQDIVKDVKNTASRIPYNGVALIGYSGGGTRALFAAHEMAPIKVDLLVLYDPSPNWQMIPVPKNVQRTLCYTSTLPLAFGLGGGQATGHNVELHKVAVPHLAIQGSTHLHEITRAAVRALEED